MTMFESVLVANRGEIAVRIIRTLRGLGIRSIAVFSDADAGARHVADADVALRLGPASATESYLSVERVIDAALRSGARAIHPGYGFLAENAALATACEANDVCFIGPRPSAIATMGDKIRAKRTVAASGVPVVPGRNDHGMSDAELVEAAVEIGYPVLVKPSAGGGGKGMRLVHDPGAIAGALASARREARSAFGDDTLLVERFIENPRHIEIQIAADQHGNIVHLGERECSLQRRHQKIIEEAPSPFLTPAHRAAMGNAAVAASRACDYTNVGTVEFIVSGTNADDFFFMEMNTRLQVEHPVTELVYGIDLVELQLAIAAGTPLPFTQDDLVIRGHSIEARLYAEDPSTGFLPTGGVVEVLREPEGRGIRIDSSLVRCLTVGSDYDPMLAKIVAHGSDRAEAMRRLDRALGDVVTLGVTTNAWFLRRLLELPEVMAGTLDTGLVERSLERLTDDETPGHIVASALLVVLAGGAEVPGDPWTEPTAWRHGGHAWIRERVELPRRGIVDVRARFGSAVWEIEVEEERFASCCLRRAGDEVFVTIDGCVKAFHAFSRGDEVLLASGGRGWQITFLGHAVGERDAATASGGPIRSPMPGRLIAVHVSAGDQVTVGQALAVVEAMKMEYTLTATIDGEVSAVHAEEGEQLVLHAPILTVSPMRIDGGAA
jgi:acetyl-CoA/propionyl-CoA carboxylase, biotin carboxylase, biotin carboxyl carrier protein